jgi:hypothetical protein
MTFHIDRHLQVPSAFSNVNVTRFRGGTAVVRPQKPELVTPCTNMAWHGSYLAEVRPHIIESSGNMCGDDVYLVYKCMMNA